jgi:hypothetical protein
MEFILAVFLFRDPATGLGSVSFYQFAQIFGTNYPTGLSCPKSPYNAAVSKQCMSVISLLVLIISSAFAISMF